MFFEMHTGTMEHDNFIIKSICHRRLRRLKRKGLVLCIPDTVMYIDRYNNGETYHRDLYVDRKSSFFITDNNKGHEIMICRSYRHVHKTIDNRILFIHMTRNDTVYLKHGLILVFKTKSDAYKYKLRDL